ncbi:imidazolonepropionase [Fontimonas sp. SYSU GA230001]|uniref:imidazolonepropionase n=1 Tax=Fontimonas sp. SYSU GA230001 TaxID=3142450 RepID=UPI0032B56D57
MQSMNVDALWINVHLATLDGAGYGIIDDGAIAVRAGRIAWLGPRSALPEEMVPALTHDGRGRWLTPGLIDCHTHLVWAGSRAREFEQRLNGATYAEIAAAGGGIRATMWATRGAGDARLRAQSAPRLRALLTEGVTTVEIKSGYGLEPETEARQLAVARALGQSLRVHVVTSFLGAHALPPEYESRADAYVDLLCTRMLPDLHAQGLVDAVDAYCETLAFTAEQVARVFDAARALRLPVKLHADQLSDGGGAALAARYRALSADHLEYSSEAGIRALAQAGTVAVLLPGAYYLLRETRRPPVDALRRHGVPMAVATDCNPGTSPCTSILLMLNMACMLFGLTPEEALAGVTRNAARALGLHGDRGRLAPGLRADFALWDIEHPADLVYALGARPCVGRVVDGISADPP